MIEESYVQSAIKIRRQYLKLVSNMDTYKRKASDFVQNIDEIQNKIEKLKDDSKNLTELDSYNKLVDVLKEIDSETKTLGSSIEPLNEEMEKLLKEEQELWRVMREKYYNLSDDDIVNYVKSRLIQEGLS